MAKIIITDKFPFSITSIRKVIIVNRSDIEYLECYEI